MIKLTEFRENIFKALRFYDIDHFALSLDETHKYVLNRTIKSLKPKTIDEVRDLTQKKLADTLEKINDCNSYLANSVNVIVLSHFEAFVDDILRGVFKSDPKLLDEYHKGEEFEKAVENELFFYHKKSYFNKVRYFKNRLGIDWSKHKDKIATINKLRNDFLHREKNFSFTQRNILAIIFAVLKMADDIAQQASKKYGLKTS